METAPFFDDVADGPDGGRAFWIRTTDNIRLRIGLWNEGGENGTVLLFPGRTEYIEKYGRTARDLMARGFSTLAIDWRGQGLADRLINDRDAGYVENFIDYQNDVHAMVDAAEALNLPKPYFLLAHSMGGCIGLRALHENLPVAAVAFSAPMWGIRLAPATKPAAWGLAWGARMMGLGQQYAPGTTSRTYVSHAEFDDNLLTNDPDMYGYMQHQAKTHPEVTLGGPSLHWLHEALKETSELDNRDSPTTPAITFLGTNERIVDSNQVHSYMARWPTGTLELLEGCEHEALMDTPEVRAQIFDKMGAFFRKHRKTPKTS